VIILQSDHGVPWLARTQKNKIDYKPHLSILNAYYLPDFDASQLYDTITPVNSFRLILNHYFGTDLEIMEDRSYYSNKEYYNFIDVTEQTGAQQPLLPK
jgi:hypothetical protein